VVIADQAIVRLDFRLTNLKGVGGDPAAHENNAFTLNYEKIIVDGKEAGSARVVQMRRIAPASVRWCDSIERVGETAFHTFDAGDRGAFQHRRKQRSPGLQPTKMIGSDRISPDRHLHRPAHHPPSSKESRYQIHPVP